MNLHEAAKNGDINRINELLDQGVDVNLKNITGSTALMAALNKGNLETVKLLLDREADVNIENDSKTTALMYAANNSSEAVKLLLDRGADLFIVDNANNSAVDYCHTQECRKLINEYIWKRLYSRDKDTASKYSKTTKLPKDVWEIILLNKRQQQLCHSLSGKKNKDVLEFFAMEFGIAVEGLSKAKLCGMIARQLAYGKMVQNKTKEEFREMEKSIKIIAKKLGIDTNQPIDKISADIGKILL